MIGCVHGRRWGVIAMAVAAVLASGSVQAQSASPSEAARAAFAEARAAADRIDDAKRRGTSLYMLATEQAKAGDTDALPTALAIEDNARRLLTMRLVAGSFAHDGNLAQARRVAEAATDPADRDTLYVSIALQQARRGEDDAALQTIDEDIATEEKRHDGLVAIIRAQSARDEPDAALRTYERLAQAPLTTRTKSRTEIARAQARVGDAAGALASAQAIAGLADQAETAEQKAAMTTDFAVSMLAGGRPDAARQIIGLLKPYPAERKRAYRECAELHAVLGNVGTAILMARSFGEEQAWGWPLNDVVSARLDADDAEGAMQAAQQIDEKSSYRVTAIKAIATHHAQAGRIDEALATVDQFGKGAGAFNELADTLAAVALAQAKAGQTDAAGQSFERGWRAAKAILSDSTRAYPTRTLVQALARSGNADAARHAAEQGPLASDRAAALIGLASGLSDPLDPSAPIPFEPDAQPDPAPLDPNAESITLHQFFQLDGQDQVLVLDRKTRAFLARLESPTVNGQPKPDDMRQAHLQAHRVLKAYYDQPIRDGQMHPYTQMTGSFHFIYNDQDAYAEIDAILPTYLENVYGQIIQAMRQQQEQATE